MCIISSISTTLRELYKLHDNDHTSVSLWVESMRNQAADDDDDNPISLSLSNKVKNRPMMLTIQVKMIS